MKYVYLIGCTKNKQEHSCNAEVMYKPSALFRASLNYALNNVNDKNSQIFVLSAKYHLLSLPEVIEPYDVTLKKMKLCETKEWGKIVYNQMQNKFDMENTHFIFLAGKDYIKPLLPYLEKNNYSIPIPPEYRSFGKRIKWLRMQEPVKQINAKELRNKESLSKVPKDMPGWYRWWAPKEALELLLNSPYIDKKYLGDLLPYLTTKDINGKKYYYIYVGIAVKEAINNRLNWHINQQHTKNNVERGILSTLRQTISSLIAKNQYDKDATNNLIDMLVVEYHTVNLPIKSKDAKEIIENIEKNELDNNVLPLNIRDNKNIIVKKYLEELKNIRRLSK